MGTTESVLIDPDDSHAEKLGNKGNIVQVPVTGQQKPSSSISTLNGIVVGLPSTGKRSLLQRLRGKDPFIKSNKVLGNGLQITVPYHAPGETFGEKLLLKVEISSSFDQIPDFYAVMVNPQQDPKTLKPYLMNLLSMLMQKNDRKVSSSVCILINFRDEHESRPGRISENDIKRWINETKKENPSSKFPLIETGVVSMMNCYGLIAFHRFIYRSYLSRKKRLLEDELSKVRKEIRRSQTIPNQTYQEFLEILKSTVDAETPPVTTTISNEEESKTTMQKHVAPPSKSKPKVEAQQKAHRFPRFTKALDIKQSLDDFFADTDEEDDVIPSTSNFSNEEEEDDFYFDEGGKRTGSEKSKPIVISKQSSSGRGKIEQEKGKTFKSKALSDNSHLNEAPRKPTARNNSLERDNLKSDTKVNSFSFQAMQKVEKSTSLELTNPKALKSKDPIYDTGSVASDGWSDDDDDIDISIENSKPKSLEQSSKSQTDIIKESTADDDGDLEDGWDDNISFDDDEIEEKVAKNTGSAETNEHEDVSKIDGIASRIAKSKETNKPVSSMKKDVVHSLQIPMSTKTVVNASPISEQNDGWNDDDDLDLDDEYVSEEMATKNKLLGSINQILDSEDSEDDFMIGVTDTQLEISDDNRIYTTTEPEKKKEVGTSSIEEKSFNTPGKRSNATVSSPGLSAAALSAIQAAQEQAQLMLGDQQKQLGSTGLQEKAYDSAQTQTFDKMDTSSEKKKKKKKKKESNSSSKKKKKPKATRIE